MRHWWLMHGYALYIWPAYALLFAVLLGNIWRARRRARQVRLLLRRFWEHT